MAASSFLMLTAMVLITHSTASLFGEIGRVPTSIRGEIGEVVDDTQSAVVTTVSNQCNTLKAVLLQTNETTQEPDVTKLTIDYITRNAYEVYNINSAAEEIPKSSWFNPNQGLVTFVHGFIDNPKFTNFRSMSDQFLARGLTNIVALNASALIGFLYLRSTNYVPYIGTALGKVLYNMHQGGMDASSMHLIGHSLGAHICGYAGKYFEDQTGVKVARITGLDPAGPCYTGLNSSMKLKSTDAAFVDTIHSNAGALGLDEDLGHLNFSPNGGSTQPGCLPPFSHVRAVDYFTESVHSPNNFVGVACNSWHDFRQGSCDYTDTALMGYGASSVARGHYYLQTAASSPFGLGEQGINYN